MPHVPGAVVFDLGKVLLDFDYSIVVRKVVALSDRMRIPEIQQLLVDSPLLPAFERGEMKSEAFFDVVRRETGFSGTYGQFVEYFSDVFTEIPPMVALHAELRRRGVPTFIFSNTNELAIDFIRPRFPFFAGFDGYVLSYEVGCMKPDAPIYEEVERLTGRSGADLIYLDDRPENVEAGAARGWQVILQTDPAKSRARLQEAGLPVGAQ